MGGADGLRPGQVGDRAGDFEYAVVGAGAEMHVLHRHLQHLLSIVIGTGVVLNLARAHGGDIVLEESPLGGLRARVRLPA